VASWAEFLSEAEPYDERGDIKHEWKKAVDKLVENGKAITGKRLLKVHYVRQARLREIEAEEARIAAEARSAINVRPYSSDRKKLPEKSVDSEARSVPRKLESPPPRRSGYAPAPSRSQLAPRLDPKVKIESKPIYDTTIPEKEQRGLRRRLRGLFTRR
jgi:hypothetical protein